MGVVQNISSDGALIEEAEPLLMAGGHVAIRFSFFEDSDPVEINADIVRETEQGFAVRFVGLDARIRRVLALAVSRVSDRAEAEGAGGTLLGARRKTA